MKRVCKLVSEQDILATHKINKLQADRKALLDALKEIEAYEDKTWLPLQCFRSNVQVAADDAKHDQAIVTAEIARNAIAQAEKED